MLFQEIHDTGVHVVHRTLDGQTLPAHVIPYALEAGPYVDQYRLVGIGLVAYALDDVFDDAVPVTLILMQCGHDGTARGVSHDQHQIAAQMVDGIFQTVEDETVNGVPCRPYDEHVADAGAEDGLRYDA